MEDKALKILISIALGPAILFLVSIIIDYLNLLLIKSEIVGFIIKIIGTSSLAVTLYLIVLIFIRIIVLRKESDNE